MKSPTNTLLPLLDFLLDLMPPSHITLVGAGNGKGVWAQWLNAQAVPATLVEADEQQFAALQRQQAAGNFAQASLLHGVVAAGSGQVAFYTSSLAAESGLLPSQELQQLWPNVHTLQSSQRQATALAQLLAPGQAQQWLLLDCLPAAALVHGATSALAQVDVVVARVLLTENQAHPIPGAGLAELAALLPEFTQIALEPSRHPDIAYALLVRDYRSATAQALIAHAAEQEARRAAIQAQEGLQARLQQAQQQNADSLKKQELQTQAQQALEADLAKVTQAHAAEGKARQAAIQAQEALQAQLKQAQHENAELLKKQELQTQAQQVLEADLAKTTQAHAAEGKARQAAVQAQEALQAQLQQAQQQNADLLKKQELQTQAQQALEADLAKITQAHAVEGKAKQAAIQAQAQAQAQAEATLAATERAGILKSLQNELQALKTATVDQHSNTKALLTTQQTSLQSMAQHIEQLDLAGNLNRALDAQLKQLAGSKESLKEVETHLRNDLNKGLANAVKQMEAFLRIQGFLGSSDALGDFHGWPISPDIGIFLLEKMREQHYDLIIEFGSGTSTALFAKGTEVLAQQDAVQAQTAGEATTPRPRTEIVTFEHDALYHGKTLQMLKARGLDRHVRLVHAPLVDWRDGEQTYLYYDCQSTLADLAQQHAHRQLRILLLVDGPPGAICPNARYPAVPFVFAALGRHQIDVVLDDASRPEEKQVIELWRIFWKQRSIRLAESTQPSEKGIYLATPQS